MFPEVTNTALEGRPLGNMISIGSGTTVDQSKCRFQIPIGCSVCLRWLHSSHIIYSSACSDFGDCERITTVGDVQQITHPDPAKSYGKQNVFQLAQKEEEPTNLKSSSMDGRNSDLDNKECDPDTVAGKTGNECSLNVDWVDYSASLNPVHADDMTRYISGDAITSDNIEAPLSLPTTAEQATNVPIQVYFSDQEENKLSMDIDFDMKVEYSPPVTQNKHGIDILTSASPQMNIGDEYMSQMYPSSFPVNTFQEYDGSNCLEDATSQIELGRDAWSEVVDDSEIVHIDCGYPEEYMGCLTLDQLDDDVLFHIASFLEARVLRFALSQVCQRFHIMFTSETYWKMRITLRWPKRFPAVSCPSDFNWVDACVDREDNHRVWKDAAVNKYHFKYLYNLFGEVDAVHLMKEGQMVVCGDRSRTLNLIDLSKYRGPGSDEAQMKDMLCHCDRVVHQGWIWSIASAGNQIVTGSWDAYVRMFDMEAGCKLTSSFKCHSSVLCLYAENNETVASCSDKKVYFFDHRTSDVRFQTFHTKPVLCVAGNENFIISGSEDKSISVFDRRAGKIFNIFKLQNYPLCMSYTDNQLWFGDRTGTLHLHDTTNGLFEDIGSYNVGHTEKMTGVVSTRGAIYTCSGDKTIKVLHPTKDPDPITTLAVHEKEIAKIDYNSGVLVSAGGDDSIGVWLPKHWGWDTYLL